MDKDGQLTFSDDSFLHDSNQAYEQIEQGRFEEAIQRLDELLNREPNYPGLVDGYRTAKFWHNRARELNSLAQGKETADFLMRQWKVYDEYAFEKQMRNSAAYQAVMKHIFFTASENYRTAFHNQDDPTDHFELLLNLGHCFLRLKEYRQTIEILEYARSSFNSNAMLLATLGEAYYHIEDTPRSLLLFREAFFINPSDIDIHLIEAKPIHDIIALIKESERYYYDIKEWISIYGFISDIFYVRKNLSRHQIDTIEREIYSLEMSYQKLNREQIEKTNVLPRLMTRYLWMFEYYELQQYNFGNMVEIRERLLNLDRDLFDDYFKNRAR